MGEFTIASLAAFKTFPTYIQYMNETQAYPGRAADADELRDHLGGDARALVRWTRAAPGGAVDRGSALMAYLELQGLRRAFGTVVALDGIDLELDKGEFLSLLGPSGCGKTTALRLVAGFDRPDAGPIVVDGKDITGVPPSRRDMGMVFQAYSLFPNMTAAQNVEFGLRMRGSDRRDRGARVGELLELVGLGHAGDRYPHQLSGGSSSGSRSRARSRSSRGCCCSTSRCRRSTRRCASSCARRSAASSSSSASPRSSSPTTRRRRCRSPTASPSSAAAGSSRWLAGRDVQRAGDAVRRRVRRHDEPARGDVVDGARRRTVDHVGTFFGSTPRANGLRVSASSS